jgi:hypothetical protein
MKRGWTILMSCVLTAMVVSGCGDRCPMVFTFPDKGQMVVREEIEGLNVDLWRTYQASRCNVDPKSGFVNRGTEGTWHRVEENENGDLMIHVTIVEGSSEEEWPGWIDCRFVEILTAKEGALDDVERRCSDLTPNGE